MDLRIMVSIAQQIEKLEESFTVERLSDTRVKVYMFVSNELNFELDIDLSPIDQGKKPKIGFEKEIKDILGNINQTLDTMANWSESTTLSEVLYELEDKLMEAATAKFTVMDEIYVLVGNYGPRATFEGKIAKVKLVDMRKNEYLVEIDATDYPNLKLKFPDKLSERIGEPDDLRFVQKWAGHLFELIGELEYRLDLYDRLNFEYQMLSKFANFVNQESFTFNPATGYISGDLEKDGQALQLDLDYMNGYPDVQPRAIVNLVPENPSMQAKIDKILADGAASWTSSMIFMRTIDKIVQAVWGARLVKDLKSNKPLEGSLYTCSSCGAEYLQASKDKEGEKFRCEYCFFGNVVRKQEKMIDDLLGKFE